jgi:hypothetical protein
MLEFLPQRMRIDSTGNVLVGTAGTSSTVAGTVIYGGSLAGVITHTYAGRPLYINRLSSPGQIVEFAEDSSTVGSIGVQGSRPYFGNSINFSIKCDDANSGSLVPANQSGVPNDNVADIGLASNRWNDLYLGGGVYLGGTGAANKLEDYEEGTWTGTLTGSTSAPSTAVTATGTYTKIGRSVTVFILFSNRDTTGVSGNILVTGLPFTAAAGGVGAGWSGRSNTGSGTTNGVMSYISSNNDLLLVNALGSAITWTSSGTGTYAQFSITYTV